MGSGKSHVGRLVADAVGLPLVDVDDAIQARTGQGVAELWRQGGEAAYRPQERAVVLEALDPARPTVLAAPGGVVTDAATLSALAADHVAVVYLRSDPRVLAERIRSDPQPRPLVDVDPSRVLADLHGARDDLYESVADLVLRSDELSPAQAAARIVAAGLLATPAVGPIVG